MSNANLEEGLYAEFDTTRGKIIAKLEHEKTPMTVGNFVALAEGTQIGSGKPTGEPFFDGITFHRVIENFMIQGGDAAGNGTGSKTSYKFPDEFVSTLRHNGPGVLSMANAGPGTNSTQFFITHVPTTWLDDKHTVFGRVIVGQDVVNAIQQDDKMNSVRIIRVGKSAEQFDGLKEFKAGFEAAVKKQEAKARAMKQTADEYVKENYPNAQKTDSGLYYIVEQEGTGAKATKGKTVSVHYTGRLADGTKFDSSYDRKKPIAFTLGVGQVISGWDEGIALMSVGAKYKLIIPAALGYGDRGAPPVIPRRALLVFDTELVEVK